MNRGLSAEQLGGLLDERHLATLATVRADGSIMLSPIWYIWEDGGFTLGVAAGDGKLKHIAREPRVTIVVADEAFPYRGFELRGVARMLDVPVRSRDPADREPLRRRGRIRLLRRRPGRDRRADRARRHARLGLRRRPRRHGRAVAIVTAFADAVEAFLAETFRLHPVFATGIGEHAHDARWPDLTPAGRAERLADDRALAGDVRAP